MSAGGSGSPVGGSSQQPRTALVLCWAAESTNCAFNKNSMGHFAEELVQML